MRKPVASPLAEACGSHLSLNELLRRSKIAGPPPYQTHLPPQPFGVLSGGASLICGLGYHLGESGSMWGVDFNAEKFWFHQKKDGNQLAPRIAGTVWKVGGWWLSIHRKICLKSNILTEWVLWVISTLLIHFDTPVYDMLGLLEFAPSKCVQYWSCQYISIYIYILSLRCTHLIAIGSEHS